MLKAKDIMTKELITVSPRTEITHTAKLLIEKGINGVPVVDEGKLLGNTHPFKPININDHI